MQNGREEARTKDKKLNCMGSSRVSEVERRRGREQPKRPGGVHGGGEGTRTGLGRRTGIWVDVQGKGDGGEKKSGRPLVSDVSYSGFSQCFISRPRAA